MSENVRFIHTADLHLDSPLSSLATRNPELGELLQDASRKLLQRLVDRVLEEQVDALLIAGDLFDGKLRDVRTAMVLQRELRRLESVDIPVFIIWGNHDAEAGLVEALDLPSNVHTFDGRGGKHYFADKQAAVHGVSFSRRQAPESLLGKFGKPDAHCFNIGMLHTSLTGSDGHNDYAPCTLNELIDKEYDYWALGHIHKRTVHHDQPAIVMPGNPLGRHINESGERSISLVTLTPGQAPEIQSISLAPVRFERIAVALDGVENKRQAFDRILAALFASRDAADADCLIVRVQLTGRTHLATSYQRDRQLLLLQLQAEFEHRKDLWIDSVDARELQLPASEYAEYSNAHSAVAELQLLISEELLDTINLQDEVAEDLKLLLRSLPAELNDMFGDTPEAEREYIVKELLPTSAQWMLRRLDNAESDNNDAPSSKQST